MHRRLSILGKAALALTLLAGIASAGRAATAGNVYAYGGVQVADGTFMSVYVSGSLFSGSSRGTISLVGPSGRVQSYIKSLDFPTSNTAVAWGDLYFVKNGVTYPARVRVDMTAASSNSRGSISWMVFAMDGTTLWDSSSTTTVAGTGDGQLPLVSGLISMSAR